MSSLLHRYATPFTTGLFLVSLISGLALFLHVGPRGFHSMHEMLSLLLILPFGLHLWRNWRPMVSYFKRGPMVIALAASAAMAALFLIPSGDTTAGGPPPLRLANAVMAQPLAQVAPALGLSLSEAEARLVAAGFTPGTGSLSAIAAAAGKDGMALQAALLTPQE